MIVFVVGLFKGGTSYTTTLLESLGYKCVVDRVAVIPGRQGGYDIREAWEVNQINNDIFNFFKQDIFRFDNSAFLDEIPQGIRNRIADCLKKYGTDIVIKDPRFIATLKYWTREIKDGQIHQVIWVNRSNEEVEKSLLVDSWSLDKLNNDVGGVVENLQKQLCDAKEKYDCGISIDFDRMRGYPERTKEYLRQNLDTEELVEPKLVYMCNYLHEQWYNQSPKGLGVWGSVVTVNQEDASYDVVHDNVSLETAKNQVVFIAREPTYVKNAQEPNGAICWNHNKREGHWLPAFFWIGTDPWEEISQLNPVKTKDFSIIDSGKAFLPGHRIRVNLINRLKVGDRYGKSTRRLPHRDKREGLLDYRYHLSVENGNTPRYFSEKICDPFLTLTTPLYYGCTNIDKFFPKGSYYPIDPNKSGVEQEIEEVIKSDFREQNLSALQEARDLVLYKYNFWPTLNEILSS